ncbi:MAG: geranylgeranylglyceryl/heptaprenylglyceryl phosphate synthase [Sphingobacteriales bacterium]|nr:geranylgeranylglyceryl/heptaprenylglyceryl phosphate synthase [Sphingobacteriales bacterium]
MKMNIYNALAEKKKNKQKSFAVLIDPDGVNTSSLTKLVDLANSSEVDYFLIGGSLVLTNHLDEVIQQIKSSSEIPVILFPGSPWQVSKYADALLYLSLISGRNPELLIGQHVLSAAQVKNSGLEILPTGYIVVDGGAATTVSYISNAAPIPADKNDIAVCTAMAGEMLGLKVMYMDAGSGAKNPITEDMIKAVSQNIEAPVFVGGGILSAERAYQNCKAGADIIVIGNAIEKNISLITEISKSIHEASE